MLRVLVLVVFLLAGIGCQREVGGLMRQVERLAFQTSGFSVLSNPATVSIKELRLSGNKLETQVVVEGRVEEFSKNSTYFVISDDSARLLVVTTDLPPKVSSIVYKGGRGSWVKVIGKVEIGKKGLPFLRASSVTSGSDLAMNGAKS